MEWIVRYNLSWLYEDKERKNLTKEVSAEDELNAAATLQFLLGDSVQVEILEVTPKD